MDEQPRAYTADEIRDQILGHAWDMVGYWEAQVAEDTPLRGRLEGVVFSILVMLDGATDLPAFVLRPDPHHEDAEFHRSEGENWYSPETEITTALHEHFYREDIRR